MNSKEQPTRYCLAKHFFLVIFYCLPTLLKKMHPITCDVLAQIAASVRSQTVSVLEDADASSSGDKRDTCQKQGSFQNLITNLQRYPKTIRPGISLVWKLFVVFLLCALVQHKTLHVWFIKPKWTTLPGTGRPGMCSFYQRFGPAEQHRWMLRLAGWAGSFEMAFNCCPFLFSVFLMYFGCPFSRQWRFSANHSPGTLYLAHSTGCCCSLPPGMDFHSARVFAAAVMDIM